MPAARRSDMSGEYIRFQLLLTESEHMKLKKKSMLAGISMNDFIRQALNEKYARILIEEIKTWRKRNV